MAPVMLNLQPARSRVIGFPALIAVRLLVTAPNELAPVSVRAA
jgi:hypothetical protein